LYDSYITDVGTSWGQIIYRGETGSGAGDGGSYATNSSVIIKKTIFDRASRGQFFFTPNVEIDDLKINRIESAPVIGSGIVTGAALPTLNNLQIYHQTSTGAAIETSTSTPANTYITITNSILDYNQTDVIGTAGGRGVKLVNTAWDRTYTFNFGGVYGTSSVTLEESYGYLPSFVDEAGNPLGGVEIKGLDIFGNEQFSTTSDASGTVGEMFVPTWQVDRTEFATTVTSFNPYTVSFKKYGKKFVTEVKEFVARTIETKQMVDDPFVTLSEAEALALTGITYTPPSEVNWSAAETELIDSDYQITLDNTPINQALFFGLYDNDTKEQISPALYTVNYQTGLVDFDPAVATSTVVRAVYSYGGSILITESRTVSEIYDYLQAQKAEVFKTDTGIIYDLYVDIILGSGTTTGAIEETETKTINIKEGYGWSAGAQGGSTKNIDSATWNFTWSTTTQATTTGIFSRQYTYDLTVTDKAGDPVASTTVILTDWHNEPVFELIPMERFLPRPLPMLSMPLPLARLPRRSDPLTLRPSDMVIALLL
jgi:hypothetical protein